MWALAKKTVYKWIGEGSFQHAAALSFATLFSLAPTLMILISLSAIFFGQEAVEGRVFYEIRGLVGSGGAETIQGILRKAAEGGKGKAAVIGLLFTAIGASAAFTQMRDSLNQIWSVKPAPQVNDVVYFLKTRILSFAMVLVVGFLLLVSLVISAVLAYFGNTLAAYLALPTSVLTVFNGIFSTAMIMVLFALIFKVLPDVMLRWRDVTTGAVLSALLFSGGKSLIALYLGNSGVTSVYGAAGSLVIIMLWVYYSSLILFIGACFIQVYTESRGIRVWPAPNTVWVRKVFDVPQL